MGVAAREIQRKYGLTGKSAWYMLHRVRFAMEREPMAGLLSGRVVVDETWIGGRPSNRHRHRKGQGGQGKNDKTLVVALVSRETGEVRSRVVPDVKGYNLRRVLDEHVHPMATHLHTDSAGACVTIGADFVEHSAVDHHAGAYVRATCPRTRLRTFLAAQALNRRDASSRLARAP